VCYQQRLHTILGQELLFQHGLQECVDVCAISNGCIQYLARNFSSSMDCKSARTCVLSATAAYNTWPGTSLPAWTARVRGRVCYQLRLHTILGQELLFQYGLHECADVCAISNGRWVGVGQNHVSYIYLYNVYTVFLAGELPNLRSYMVHLYGSGQSYKQAYSAVWHAAAVCPELAVKRART